MTVPLKDAVAGATRLVLMEVLGALGLDAKEL